MGVFRVSTIGVLVMALLAPSLATAQYFGRNKVAYKDFDFRILTTEHFDVYYYSREERAARLAAQLAERWYTRFSQILRHRIASRQPLVLYGSQAEFAQTNVISGLVSDTVGGVTESARRRIALPFAPTMVETDRVLGHEIAHAFQFDIARKHGGAMGLPLWFIEGMAEYLARGAADAEAGLWLRDAVLHDRLPRHERDAAWRLSPYQYGHAFWSYLAQRFGDDVLEKTLKPGKGRSKLNDRMRDATGLGLGALYEDWRAAVRGANPPSGAHASAAPSSWKGCEGGAGQTARDCDVTPGAFGRVQLNPALSPDGRQAVFFSERDRLSLDLYLANVETHRIIRKLATTAATGRFDSLQPIRSAGSWSPDGEWFAFPAVRRGRAALVLVDIANQHRDREILLDRLGQVLSPTWSPDGQALAFSALSNGFSDLYVYDLRTSDLRQLTNDAFADLHPAWSPDGQTLAFATERYSSDLTSLRFGRLKLAAIDVQSGQVRPVPVDVAAEQLNPQWSHDGRQLYFVANPDQVSNVFRLDLETRATQQITDVATGVSGVTPTSPALSVARRADVMGFTEYRNGRYELAIVREPAAIPTDQVGDGDAHVTRVAEPSPSDSLLATLLADSRSGLPDPESIVDREYTSRLSLERIGQPYVASGAGPFGTFVRGGGALLFGDMLGGRRLFAATQVGNRLHDLAFDARYLNQERRWNWGALAELQPTLRRYRRSQIVHYAGESALFEDADYLQRTEIRAAGVLAYPFSRGLRMEFSGGVRHAAYREDRRTRVSSLATGRVLESDRVESSGGPAMSLAEIGTALVGDAAVFGPTGALFGTRYRFEVAPAVGSLGHTRVLIDYRKYVMPVRPYTVAMRVLHSGRYGRHGGDPRLLSSYLGSPYLVRGHGWDAHRCQPDATGACGDELIGNRLLVGNIELRVPIWGMLSRQIEYGPLPADAFIFADGGMMWLPANGHRRTVISSLGAGVRLSAGGLPVELAAVRALDGPTPRWLFDLGFRVGF